MLKASRRFDPLVDDIYWKALFEQHFQDMQSLNAISTMWIHGFSKLGLDNSKRPLAEDLSATVMPYTGFTFVQTNENVILEQIDWYQLIAKRKMPLTSFVRRPDELGYCDEPDIWHDVMGHVPFLAEQRYADMYVRLANVYIHAYASERKDLMKELDFVGGMLIELGLIKEAGGLKALGSTFYSSSEIFEAFKPENQITYTTPALSSGESYDRHSFQGKYYILDSFSQLEDIIGDIASRL